GHTASLLSDGRVLVAGGYTLGRLAVPAEIFDPSTNRFTIVGNLLWPRTDHVALLLPNGNVLIAGGRGYNYQGKPQVFVETGWLQTEIFDVQRSVFIPGPLLTRGRPGCTGVVLPDGRPMLFGGGDDTVEMQSADVFDPATGKFVLEWDSWAGRQQTATVLPDGRVVLIGGLGVPAVQQDVVLSSMSFYDPRTDQFSGSYPVFMQEPRHSHTATL